ncbi:hypothetical protein [Streptomyces sp. IBSNAI001]|uniref:hypothetical protein n=1 Tax=Streptomyces sp. IBSNAI001 TaxID=3457499 RepID=UPI003FD094E5
MSYIDRIPARALCPLDTIIYDAHDRTNVLVAQPTPDHGMFVLEVPWLAEANVSDATARYFEPEATVLVLVESDEE